MARMIPDFIDQEDSRLDGERKVFSWLSSEPVEGVALHSLLQKNQKRKIIGEVDFLLASRRGILCLEVKGGMQISRREGLWYSVSKKGIENLIKDPFRQAKDCMYALKSHLIDTYGKKSPLSNLLIGYGVIFPECIFTGHGNDLVTEVVFDCKWDLDEFPGYIKKTFDFWADEEQRKHSYLPNDITDNDVKQLVDLLRGDFSVVPSINLAIQQIERELLILTEEQFDALDITLNNKRVLIQGGAGTGKSLLAIEKARKTIAAGKRVLYVCFNRNMAKLARMSLEDIECEDSYIGTYHKLVQTALGFEYEHMLDPKEISNKFLENKCKPVQLYDTLIIDEGQDLMDIKVWEVLGEFLRGGFENGEWVMFFDPNQNIFNKTDNYDFALEYLKEIYAPAIIPLTKNCRNTEPIGRKTSMLTLVPPAKHMRVSGPKVIIRTYNSKKEMINIFRKELISLVSGGTSAEDIVILSKYKLENSFLQGVENICGLPLIEVSDISYFHKRALNYFTVHSFKGLESKIVMFVDIDGFLSEKDRLINYVGMSRAKILLYIYYHEEKKNEYIEITTESLDYM